MLYLVRVVASLSIALWGLVMVLLGVVNQVDLWVPLGLAVIVAGLPLLASHPLAAGWLYPPATGGAQR